MSDHLCEIISENAALSDQAFPTISALAADAPSVITEVVSFVVAVVLSSTATIGDNLDGTSTARIAESASITDAGFTVGTFQGRLNEDSRVTDRVRLTFPALFEESVAITDEALPANAFVLLSETAAITETAQPSAIVRLDLNEDTAATDSALPFKVAELADSADFADSAIDGVRLSELVQEQASIADEALVNREDRLADRVRVRDQVFPSAQTTRTLAESGSLTDRTRLFFSATLTDSASAAGAVMESSRGADLLTDSGQLSADAAATATMTGTLREAGADFTDAAVATATLTARLNEDAVIEDMAIIPGAGAAWAAPTDGFAMSRWEILEAESIAEVDGQLYAAGPVGLYRLERGQDDHGGALVDARIRGGLNDLGDANLKRASAVYLGYECAGLMRVTVGTIPAGVEESYSYPFPARPADMPTPAKAKLGRGQRSRYWRVSMENVDGADFTIHSALMDVETMSRRV